MSTGSRENNDKNTTTQSPPFTSFPSSTPSRPSTPLGGWSPFPRLESVTSVLLSPLTNRMNGDTVNRTLHLMQQRQVKKSRTDEDKGALTIFRNPREIPTGDELLASDIPESTAPLSLFQGFKATYPTYAKKKDKKDKRKKITDGSIGDADSTVETHDGVSQTLTQLLHDRDRLVRESDKIQAQRAVAITDLQQTESYLADLNLKKKNLEQKILKFDERETVLLDQIEEVNEKIIDFQLESNNFEKRNRDTEGSDFDIAADNDFEPGVCLATLYGHDDMIIQLDFDRPYGTMVTSSYDNSVRVWDMATHKCLGVLEGHSEKVRALQLHTTNTSILITGSDDWSIKQWDLSLISPTRSVSPSVISAPSSPVTSPRNSLESESASKKQDTVPILDGVCVGTMEGHNGDVTAVHADDRTLVSGSSDKSMKQWDLETNQCILTLDIVSAISGNRINNPWLGTQSDKLNSWSATETSYAGYSSGNPYAGVYGGFVGALQFWGFALASGTVDGNIRMWDLRNGAPHRTLAGHTGPITTLMFDEVHLVSGSLDKSVRIWDLRTGSIVDMFSYESGVTGLHFDTYKIASAAGANDVKIYNRGSFSHTSFVGHTQPVTAVKFRENVLASGGIDHVVKLWTWDSRR